MHGLNRSFERTGVGLYEIFTFPIPNYAGGDYGPIMRPTGPVYPDSYRPGWISDTRPSCPDTALGFAGGDVAPMIPAAAASVSLIAQLILQTLEKHSFCKVNLLLNILGKRLDGFHELETVMHPVFIFDNLSFARYPSGIMFTCGDSTLPTDGRNLVVRAASAFFAEQISEGVSFNCASAFPSLPVWAVAAATQPRRSSPSTNCSATHSLATSFSACRTTRL